MSSDIYERLRSRLDTFPTSFPKTADGIEIAILKKLFSEEEADMAAQLPLMDKEEAETVQKISDRTGMSVDELGHLLEAMAKKGLIYVEGDKESRKFSLLPFMPGIYEFNYDKVDRELADLLEKYMGQVYRQMSKSKIPVGRLIPISQTFSPQTTVHTYEDIVKAIETSSSISVTPCICRTKKKALDKGCAYPLETCLYLNDYADYLNEIGKGRKLTKEEALAILRETESDGLVHLSTNHRETPVICSCCPCCCPGLKGLIKIAKKEKLESGPRMNFRLVIDEDQCTLCETCVERCWTEALSVEEERLALNPARCIGCGACVSTCPSEAISLERKADAAPTPDDFKDMFSQMGWRSQ